MPKKYTPAEAARTFVSVFHSSPRAADILVKFLSQLAAQNWPPADVEETRRQILERMPHLRRPSEGEAQ